MKEDTYELIQQTLDVANAYRLDVEVVYSMLQLVWDNANEKIKR